MIRATLQSCTWLSRDVRAVVLRPHREFRFEPGQYVGVGVRGGPSRCFSMARAPAPDNCIELHIRRWPGGAFSDRVLGELEVGAELDLTGPLGAFAYPQGDGPVVMLATGTGIAPLMAMLEACLPVSGRRPIRLFWGVRSVSDLYARRELNAWKSKYPNFCFTPVISSLGHGRVQDAARKAISDPWMTHVLACGNPAMITDAHRALVVDASVPVAEFDADAFEPASPVEPAGDLLEVAQAESAQTAPTATIELHIGDHRIEGRPGESVLSALKRAGRPVMSVCGGKASCGTCIVHIDAPWIERLPAPARTERNLLACLPGLGNEARLGCQIELTPALNGLALSVPLFTSI